MSKRLWSSGIVYLVIGTLLCAGSPGKAQTVEPTPVKKQMAADRRAYRAARAIDDPAQSIAALREFQKNYPKSSRVGRAQEAVFALLVQHFPERKPEIEAAIHTQLKQMEKGSSRARTEAYLAYQLAEAGPLGVDLPRAEKLAKDAVHQVDEPGYDKETIAAYAKYKQPTPAPAALHKEFASLQAEDLSILANVYLHEGKQALAAPLVAQAYALDPLIDDVNTERGRLALLNHDNVLALSSFERAQLLGSLQPPMREKMMELYREAHGGSTAGFDADMDARYSVLFPAAFVPEKASPSTTGHTALVELFTGSACPPCVGGDLAVEGVLEAYPRQEVVALAFDQHIPEPDPLANPESIARADFYDIAGTPSFTVDGEMLPASGGDREGSKRIYDSLKEAVDTAAGQSNGVGLRLTTEDSAGGMVQAHAVVTLPSGKDVDKALAVQPEARQPDAKKAEGKEPAAKATGAAAVPVPTQISAPVPHHLVVNFALVEDGIRYSGENGVRFHRMVVRALAKPADSGFPVSADGSFTLDASFDPAAISNALSSYLDTFEQHNELGFGKIKFLSKDTAMQHGHLAVAVWVQDTVTHRILQAAFAPVNPSTNVPVAATK